jgi:threonine dehydrogenase-like Zn-dependent dehydrogenase
VDDFPSHVPPLEQAAQAYEIFQKKQDGAVKVMLKP